MSGAHKHRPGAFIAHKHRPGAFIQPAINLLLHSPPTGSIRSQNSSTASEQETWLKVWLPKATHVPHVMLVGLRNADATGCCQAA
jgi:hypothetical protein